MSELTPTRSVVLELRDEQRAMHEGYVFLDEKCLLLAAEIVAELGRYATLAQALREANEQATRALVSAIARHGLEGLQLYPAGDLGDARLDVRQRSLMGVALVEAKCTTAPVARPAAIDASPEAERCRAACAALVGPAAALAAVAGNLERLSIEYQRSLRRARALAEVLLPEIARSTAELETRLEELEQEDAIWMSRPA
jgi:V/A-type H+-transporting ATPase subunit D